MVQTSNEQSRKAYVEVRGGMTYYHTDEPQTEKGWFWCSQKRAYFRFTDWNLTLKQIGEKYGFNS